MKNFQIIFAFLLIVASFGLHVKYHQSPESYLAALKLNQNGISSQLLSLKNDVSQVQTQVNSQSDTAKKIKLLEQAILKQKAKLSTLSKSLIIPLNESSSTCKTLLKTSDSELQTLASSIVSSTNSLDQLTNKLSNQTYSPLFTQDSSAASALSKELQKSVYATGQTSENLVVGKETNWLAPNWITGTQTPAQVQNIVKNKDQLSGFLITCPLATPFYDGTNCFNCQNGQYFNFQTKKCVTCNNFDITTHKCNDLPPLIKPTISNFQTGLSRMVLQPGTDAQALKNLVGSACPATTPFLTSSGCINCEAPNSLFDYSKQVCTTCPTGKTYIPQKYSCIQSIKSVRVTNLPIGGSKMVLPDGTTIDTLQAQQVQQAKTATLDVCPADKPFYNNVDCISCPADQYFIQSKLGCEACPSGQKYNQTVHQCIKTTFYSNLLNRNWTSTNPDSIRNSTKTASLIPGSSPCPIEQPFFDGFACKSCPANQQYNYDGSTCEVCSAGTIFSANLHSCVKYEPNAYQTNPQTAPNLIYDGTSISQYMQQYQNNISQHPHMIDCSAKDPTRPYYDGISCISCPPEFPNFNLKTKVCQICVEGTYDAKEHECMSSNDQIISQKPNIQKILASIFT